MTFSLHDLAVPIVGAPMRHAAVTAGDPHGTNLWAGTAWRDVTEDTAPDIVAALAGEVA